MPVAIPEDLQNLVDDIEEYQSLFQNDRLQRQIIDFVRSLHTLEEPTSTETIKGLATQIKGDLHPIQIDALTLFLKKAIRINNITVRVNTVKLLGYLGDSARSAIPELIELIELEANQESVRIYTSQALASIGLFKYQDAQQLIRYIKSPNPQIQENIIAAIAKLRQEAAPLIPELQRILEEPSKPDENVTRAIISCFGEMGEKARQIVPLLSDYLRPEKSIAIRSATAQALARIGQISQKAISELIAGLEPLDKLAADKEDDDLRRIVFVDALAQSSLEIDKIVGELSRFSGDEALEHYIIQALARINSISSVKSLTELLLLQDDPDVAISNALHQIDLGGKWEAKSDIILSILNQRVPPPLSNKDGLFLHLFYGMLPPSKAKSISDDWDRAETENLYQILIDKTLEYQTNSDLFETILQIVSFVTSRRLEQSESVLKQKIDKYKASHKQLLENLQELKSSLRDKSTSQIADKLTDKVTQSVKRPPVLNRLGRRQTFEPEGLDVLIMINVIIDLKLKSENERRIREELNWLFKAVDHFFKIHSGQVSHSDPIEASIPQNATKKHEANNTLLVGKGLLEVIEPQVREKCELINAYITSLNRYAREAADQGRAGQADIKLQNSIRTGHIKIIQEVKALVELMERVYGIRVHSPDELIDLLWKGY